METKPVNLLLFLLIVNTLIGCKPNRNDSFRSQYQDSTINSNFRKELNGINHNDTSHWIRLSISDTGFYKPCRKCMDLNIPYYSVNSIYGNMSAQIFFNRYDFFEKHFSWGIFPTGDRVIVVEDWKIWSEDPFHNLISEGKHQIEWTDSSLFFSFMGKRRNFGIHDKTVPMRQFLAVHYILREGNNLSHTVYEDTIPPFETPSRKIVIEEGATLKITGYPRSNEIKIFYNEDSAIWENIEVAIEK